MIASIGKLRNRQLAHAVLAAFAAGFLGAPGLHQLAHQRPHQHGADGFSIQWLADDHGGKQPHTHSAAAQPASETPPGGALGTPSPAPHGPGGASHFGVGIVAPPSFLLPPPAAEAIVVDAVVRPGQPAARFSYAVARPRGPPVG